MGKGGDESSLPFSFYDSRCKSAKIAIFVEDRMRLGALMPGRIRTVDCNA